MNFRFLYVFFIIYNHPIIAQETDILDDLLKLSIVELLQVEIDVASKSKETIFDAPSSVTVFTRQELLNMGLTSVEQVLNYVPGFIATRELVFSSGYMVAARGMTSPQASYNVLFMIDGQRLNNDLSGGALLHNTYIPLANVKQIEVIRGPGSALYGTSAFSGVVNIVTETKTNDAFVSAGNMASREAYTNFSKQFDNGHFAGFVRYFEDNGQKIYQNVLQPEKLTSDPLKGNDIYLSTKYDRLQFKFRHTQRHRDEFSFLTETVEGVEKYFTEHQSAQLSYRLYDTDDIEVDIDFNYMQMRNKTTSLTATLDSLPDSLDKSQLGNLLEGRNAKETELSFNIEAHYFINNKHEFIAGLQYRKPKTDYAYNSLNYDAEAYNQVLAATPPTGYFNYTGNQHDVSEFEPAMSRSILGIYVQDKYKFNAQWATTLGLRYDHYAGAAGGTVNPRATLTYAPTEKTKFKWMYGEAFRAPSLRQNFTNIPGLGNPNLEPETIKTLELAWLQQFERTQTTVTYFHSQAKNRIDTILLASPLDDLRRQFNNLEGELTSAGWEVELFSKLTNNLSLRTAYTYMSTIEQSPKPFPKQTVAAILNYQHHDWNINLNAYYHDTMEHPIGGGEINLLDDYWVLHSALRYNLTADLTIVGHIHNLLNEEYYNSTKYAGVTDGVLNRGRTYSLGIELQF